MQIALGVTIVVVAILIFLAILVMVSILKQFRLLRQDMYRLSERYDHSMQQYRILVKYLQHYEVQLARWYNHVTGLNWEMGYQIMRPPGYPASPNDHKDHFINDIDLIRYREQTETMSERDVMKKSQRATERRRNI